MRATFSRRHFEGRHALRASVLVVALFTIRTIVYAFRGLDYVLYPGFRSAPIVKPVFITGNPRSGTTFLHRLLSLDDQFTSMRLAHSLFPSVCLHRLLQRASRLDRRTGGRIRSLLGRVDDRGFGAWDEIHPTGLEQHEEDEQLFVYMLLTPVITLLWPFFDDLREIEYVDRLPARIRTRVMRDYISSLHRHIHAHGPGKTLLTKNTSLAGRLESTLQVMPDMRVIDIVRHPYQAIPSLLSMYDVTWKRLAPGATASLDAHRQLARLYADYYRRRISMKSVLPDTQFLEVRFEDLTEHPESVVREIYDAFGLGLSVDVRARLVAACARGRSHRSRHRYSLEQFGLSKEWVFAEMRDVFEHYGFDPEHVEVREGNTGSALAESTSGSRHAASGSERR